MQLPIQISFRNMESSPAVEARIRDEAKKLSEFYDQINGCCVMAELPHRYHTRGKGFHFRIDLTVPGSEIVVNHEPSLHHTIQQRDDEERTKELEIDASHKDALVAFRDAIKTAPVLGTTSTKSKTQGETSAHCWTKYSAVRREGAGRRI